MTELTDRYSALLILSLDAQEVGDRDIEDGLLHQLDRLWLEMNSAERKYTDELNRIMALMGGDFRAPKITIGSVSRPKSLHYGSTYSADVCVFADAA